VGPGALQRLCIIMPTMPLPEGAALSIIILISDLLLQHRFINFRFFSRFFKVDFGFLNYRDIGVGFSFLV